VAGCTGPGSTGLLVLSLPTIFHEDQESASVDRTLFRGNRLAVQFFYANISQFAPTGGGVNLGQGQNAPAKNKHAALTDTETFSSSLLNEFRVGFTNIKSATLGTENVNVNYRHDEMGWKPVSWDTGSFDQRSAELRWHRRQQLPGGRQHFDHGRRYVVVDARQAYDAVRSGIAPLRMECG
jgi:hypothetical protein